MDWNAVVVSHDHTCTRPIRSIGFHTWLFRPMGAQHRPAVDIRRWAAGLRSVVAEKASSQHLVELSNLKISLERWFACKNHLSPTPIPRQTPQAWGRSGQQSGRRQTARWRRWRGRCWWTSPSTRSSPGWGQWCPRRPLPTWTPSWPQSTISSTCRASWNRLPCQDSSNISKTLRQPCLIVYLPLCLYCDKYILQNYVYIYLSFLNSVFFWSVLTETKNNFTCRRRCKHYWLKILRKQGSM